MLPRAAEVKQHIDQLTVFELHDFRKFMPASSNQRRHRVRIATTPMEPEREGATEHVLVAGDIWIGPACAIVAGRRGNSFHHGGESCD